MKILATPFIQQNTTQNNQPRSRMGSLAHQSPVSACKVGYLSHQKTLNRDVMMFGMSEADALRALKQYDINNDKTWGKAAIAVKEFGKDILNKVNGLSEEAKIDIVKLSEKNPVKWFGSGGGGGC